MNAFKWDFDYEVNTHTVISRRVSLLRLASRRRYFLSAQEAKVAPLLRAFIVDFIWFSLTINLSGQIIFICPVRDFNFNQFIRANKLLRINQMIDFQFDYPVSVWIPPMCVWFQVKVHFCCESKLWRCDWATWLFSFMVRLVESNSLRKLWRLRLGCAPVYVVAELDWCVLRPLRIAAVLATCG